MIVKLQESLMMLVIKSVFNGTWKIFISGIFATPWLLMSKSAGLNKRTCRGLDDTNTLRTLCCALVRSNIEYSSVLWSPYTKRNMEKFPSSF